MGILLSPISWLPRAPPTTYWCSRVVRCLLHLWLISDLHAYSLSPFLKISANKESKLEDKSMSGNGDQVRKSESGKLLSLSTCDKYLLWIGYYIVLLWMQNKSSKWYICKFQTYRCALGGGSWIEQPEGSYLINLKIKLGINNFKNISTKYKWNMWCVIEW